MEEVGEKAGKEVGEEAGKGGWWGLVSEVGEEAGKVLVTTIPPLRLLILK